MLQPKLAVAASLLLAGNLALAQCGSRLTGVDRDLSAAPVAGVLLALSSLDRALQTKSAKDGRFRFESIPTGKYELELSAQDFVEQRLPVNVSGITAQVLTIVLRSLESVPDMNHCGSHPSVEFNEVPAGYYDLRILRGGYRPAELKQLLVPSESGTSVDLSMVKKKRLIACKTDSRLTN